jgi:peptide/nickel transport system substrate-binding protein
MAGVVGGCSGAAASSTTTAHRQHGTSGSPLVAVHGGTVTVAADDVPTTLNDHSVAGDTAGTRAVCSLVWGQVFQVAPGVTPKLDTTVVDDAEVVSVAPQTVVYHIDPRAQWSDGAPLSAQDFVYAWLSQGGSGQDAAGAPDSVASTTGYRDIASVVGSDAGRTVTVVFQHPYADWMALFDDLLPAHIADKAGWNHGFDRFDPAILVSAGPFLVSAWSPGRSIVLVRNPHWWGTPAAVDEIVVRATAGAPSMVEALLTGQAHVAAPSGFGAEVEAAVSSSPTLQSKLSLGTTVLQLVFDVRRAPLDEATVRQGIAHLVDRAGIASALVQPISPLTWEDNDHLFANTEAWYGDDAGGYEEPDPVTGWRDLVAGGLVPDARGSWTLHGAPVDLRLAWATDDPWSALVAPAIAAQLVGAGFEVTTEPTTSGDLLGVVLPAGGFDLALVPLDTGAFPSRLAPAFGMPPDVGRGSVADWSGFDDPKIDALFTQASGQLAAAQARQLYQQIDTALWAAMPVLPLFAEPSLLVWSASLVHVQGDPGGLGPLWSAPTWSELGQAAPHGTATRTTQRP